MNGNIDLFSDPRWFADTLNVNAGFIEFVHTDRSALADAPFLDERFSGQLTSRRRVALDHALRTAPPPPENTPFIFHTAFCCSTLLARALDHPGTNLSLKEPKLLTDLADARRLSARLRNDPHLCPRLTNCVLSLLSRRFTANESILIKPTNMANTLIPDILASGSRTLLLYSDLRGFLVSVIKGGEGRRGFVRNALNKLRLDPGPLGRIPDGQVTGFTDLQVATLVWRHQMEEIIKILRGPHGDRARTLDCAVLLARPAAALAAVNAYLALGLPAEALRTVAEGPVFSIDAKNRGRGYSPEQRAADTRGIEAQFGDALEQILNWAKKLRLAVDVPATIPNILEIPAPAASPAVART